MEPQSTNHNKAPNQNLERQGQTPEVAGMSENARKLEGVPLTSLERVGDGVSHEAAQGSNDSVQASTSDAVVTLPSVPAPAQDASMQTTTQDATNPASAADDDVIEKEWVSKAKTVINSTKGDPYAKEREVSKLQADYLQKRYGKQVKMPNDTQ